jgi:peptide/nickel transport system permease protein
MTGFILLRLASMIVVLFVVALITFLLIYFAPGDPAIMILGDQADVESVARLHRELGLDGPAPFRFALWLQHVLRGDFGKSIYNGEGVLHLVVNSMEPSALLSLMGTSLAVLFGVPLGVLAGVRRGTIVDRLVMIGAVVGMSTPSFWLSLNLILLFSLYLRWTPVSGYVWLADNPLGTLRALALPAVSVALVQAAWLARVTRSAILEVLDQDYVRTARAKGVLEGKVIFRHALSNALLPIVTVMGIVIISLFSSQVIIEAIFGLPGLGRLVTEAMLRRDFPVIQGALLIVGVCYVAINLVVDVVLCYLDPRLRLQ